MVLHTLVYIAIACVFLIVLSFRTINARREAGVSLGPGEDPKLLQAMRAHANFLEYTPIFIIGLGAAEFSGLPWQLVHVAGLIFFAGRAIHANGLLSKPQNVRFRVIGMQITITTIGLLAIACIVLFGNQILLG